MFGSWKRKLRVGVIGGGQGAFIGVVHRLAAQVDLQAELVAGCFSRDPENTRQTGKDLYLDPSRCYDNYEMMAANEAGLPDDQRIDFVIIATPNTSHTVIAKAFLNHGIHVVCDKPLATSVAEAQELVDLVEKTGLVFGLTHNYTGTALLRHARSLFKSGAMGQVRKVLVEYMQDFFMYPHEKEGQKQAVWRTDPSQAGPAGTLADCGSHCINLLEYITGDPVTELCADKSTFLPDRVLDEDMNFLLRFQGGGKGVMTISQIATGEENGLRLKIYCSQGAIIWEQETPNELKLYQYNQPRQVLTRGQGYLAEHAASSTRFPTGHPEGFLESFANIYVGIIEAVRAHIDEKPLSPDQYDFPTVYDGLREMVFIEKALESCQNGSRWVKLSN